MNLQEMKSAKDILNKIARENGTSEGYSEYVYWHDGMSIDLVVKAMEEYASQFTQLKQPSHPKQLKYLQDMTEEDFVTIFGSRDFIYSRTGFTSLASWGKAIGTFGQFTSWDKAKELGYDVNFTMPIKRN